MRAGRWFYLNLVLAAAAGICASLALTRYTNSFLTFSGLLSLGGVLSVVAALLKSLPESRLGELREGMGRALDAGFSVVVLGACLLAAAAVLILCGAVEVIPPHDGLADISIQRGGIEVDREVIFEAHRFPTLVGVSPSEMIVKARGYPARKLEIGHASVQTLRVPESFVRRIVLVRGSDACFENIARNPVSLVIRVGEHMETRSGYRCEAFWLSPDADLEVPSRLLERWRALPVFSDLRLAGLRHPAAESRFGEPQPNATITVQAEGRPLGTFVVSPLGASAEYVQEVIVP